MRLRATLPLGLATLATLATLCALLFAAFVTGSAGAGAYPVTTCSTLSVSTTNPIPGEAITVAGSNFRPHASVALVLTPGNSSLGHVTSSSSGTFTTSVTLPDSATNAGEFDIVATSGAIGTTSCPVDPSQSLAVQADTTATNGGDTGRLSVTGLDIAGLLALAAALVGTGVLLNRRTTRVGSR